MVFYIETGCTDSCFNLAFEEYILTHKTSGDWLMLWQNANTIVIGLNQNTAEEVNPEFIKTHHTTIVRRQTGGGAVYHDLGNLNYSFITDTQELGSQSIFQFTAPVCAALKTMGIEATASGRNDITIREQKISGAAQRIYKERILHHGTLLFDSNLDMVSEALKVTPEKFQSKSVKSVRSRVTNIRNFLTEEMSINDFWQRLRTELTSGGAMSASLTEEELCEIRALAETKYRSWDWTWGKFPAYSKRNRKHFPGGTIAIDMDVQKGILQKVTISGDFMALKECTKAVEALSGIPFTEEAVEAALDMEDFALMFGGIRREEIVQTMFE